MSSVRLAPRRRKFAAEYVKNGFNGVQAIAAAGYSMGYNAACVEASRLLRNPKVYAKVEEHIAKSKMDADEVAKEIASVARTKTPISGPDKMKALDLLTKINGMITQKIETVEPDVSSFLSNRIKISAQKSNISEPQAACKLFDTLLEWGSEHADPANFGPWAEIVANHAKAQQNGENEQITEIGDQ